MTAMGVVAGAGDGANARRAVTWWEWQVQTQCERVTMGRRRDKGQIDSSSGMRCETKRRDSPGDGRLAWVASWDWKCDGEGKQMVIAQRDASTLVVVQGTIVGVKGVSKVGGQRQRQGQKNKRAWPPGFCCRGRDQSGQNRLVLPGATPKGPPNPRL